MWRIPVPGILNSFQEKGMYPLTPQLHPVVSQQNGIPTQLRFADLHRLETF